MAADNVQVLRDAYAAFARQDVDAVLAVFDEDITWTTPDTLPFGGTVHGHDGVMGFFASIGQQFSELTVEPVEFIDAGDTVVVITHDHASGPNGSMDGEVVHLWRMRDGKAVSFREYADAVPALRILGVGAAAAAS